MGEEIPPDRASAKYPTKDHPPQENPRGKESPRNAPSPSGAPHPQEEEPTGFRSEPPRIADGPIIEEALQKSGTGHQSPVRPSGQATGLQIFRKQPLLRRAQSLQSAYEKNAARRHLTKIQGRGQPITRCAPSQQGSTTDPSPGTCGRPPPHSQGSRSRRRSPGRRFGPSLCTWSFAFNLVTSS